MTLLPAISGLTRSLGIGAAVMCVFASAAHAGDRISVEKNHTRRITLPAAAASVIVGNPDIADVNVVDSRTIYIMGKGFGSSTVTVTGRDGKALFDADVIVSAAQNSAITVYKGLTPSLMVCSNVCIQEDVSPGSVTAAASAPAPSLPAPAAFAPVGAVAQ